jgi:hypothetical protein
VTLRVGVHSQKKIELILSDFDDAVQVSALEQTVIDPLTLREIGVHPFKGSIEQS